jgi:putative ABC transport system permease protein
VTGAWKLAYRNLRRHRRRNVVTGLAIALGYAGLAVLGGYAGWAERLIRTGSVYMQHRGHFAVYAKGGLKRAEAKPSAYALPPEAQEKIVTALQADPRVEYVGRYLVGSGIVGNGCKSYAMRAVGAEPDLERRLASHPEMIAIWGRATGPASGRPFFDAPGVEAPVAVAPRLARALEKVRPSPGGAPASAAAPLDCGAPDVRQRLAADPFVQLGARTVDGSFGAVEAQVVGLYRPASTDEDKTALVAPIELLQRLYDTDRVTYVAAYLRDHRDLAAVERDLAGRLRAAGVEVSTHRFDDPVANPFYAGTMALLGALVLFIVLLVANVVAFSVLNAMTLAAIERAREMGTLRSLGFTRGQVRGLFLREAALLTVTSVLAGAALAAAAAVLVRVADVRFEPPGSGTQVHLQFMPAPEVFLGTAALFLVLTLAGTVIAVRRKARTPVAELVAEVAA